MNRNRTRVRAWMAAACGALLLATAPHALAWPDRPIKIVVGYAAGGIADAGARIVAQRLQEKYGQAVTIDNKAGAAGRLATDAVAKAEPDGYTILLAVGGDTVVAASDPKLPYNLLRDFRFASTLSVYPFLLMSSPSSRTPTLQALCDTGAWHDAASHWRVVRRAGQDRVDPGAVQGLGRGNDRRGRRTGGFRDHGTRNTGRRDPGGSLQGAGCHLEGAPAVDAAGSDGG
jgi:hypothetical protein